ncbi:HHL264Wp [Eremothecium sinecaudum]|uniref:Carnitine O-acetyltransferase, mitochondrial n=1 Tax=Eremothecium sinecaudum TaxID=45286 RepID=A0A0X8HVZ3_9SACH|nr:HHL264Wp [Eremothecium sinecaudum]AMD22506.1 HHL264Wp [Eremothecium sinecaudum]
MFNSRASSLGVRRMMSSLKVFQNETQNGEVYLAKHSNSYYQNKMANYKGETFSKQGELPSLPVPDLNSTLNKYLASIAPFCETKEEYEHQKYLCSDFLNNKGMELHGRLLEFAQGRRNWMGEFWDRQMYLDWNEPIVPFSSYFFGHKALPLSHGEIESDYLLKATAIITTVIRFLEHIKAENLPVEMRKGEPYCMNSFQLIFNSSRVPGEKGDGNVFYSIYENNFITVAYHGNFYKVFTHDESGQPLSAGEIWHQLYAIVNQLSHHLRENTNTGVGVLTTLPRDQWYQVYKQLETDYVTRDSLETIQKSAFLLALDVDKKPITLEEKARNYWHGDGINRYHDKTMQFFVCGNGASGYLAEHSKSDGTPNLFLNHYLCTELRKLDPTEFVASVRGHGASSYTPQHLPFILTPAIQDTIKAAKATFDKTVYDHEIRVWNYNRYGKKAIKSFGMSPNSYLQQIIQLAIYKYIGRQLPTYEAASTRKYFKGRTETGRSVSVSSAKFVKTWQSPHTSIAEKVQALRESSDAHSKYMNMACEGQGVDRHFFGMKNMLREGEEPPALFKDPLFKYSSTWLVSTSQLSSEYFEGYGWSQVWDNGYGLAYMINNDFLQINIATRPGKSGYSAHELHYYLTEAANEMFELLSKSSKSKM